MKKVVLAAGILAALTVAAVADGPKPAQLALFQEKTIFHSGLKGRHTIALTFDDGPNARTGEVLDALRALNVRATFFVVGRMARKHPEILARIAREGHLLANHSATHSLLSSRYNRNPDLLLREIRDVHDQIAPLMAPGDKFYFRAPYGAWKYAHAPVLNADPELRRYVGPIFWDVGGDIALSRDGYVMSAADWDCWNLKWTAKACAKGYTREIRRKDGGVVLMHAIHVNSAELVRQLVPPLIEEGYRFVRLDEMPQYRQYETPKDRPRGVASLASAPVRVSAVGLGDYKSSGAFTGQRKYQIQ